MGFTVTVYSEYIRDRYEGSKELYPDGIHEHLASEFTTRGHETSTVSFATHEDRFTNEKLRETDVLVFWEHKTHEDFDDAIADRIARHVREGMGLIVLHSANYSKVFLNLMGTSCGVDWRTAAETERLWVTAPGHPITAGIDDFIELPQTEMYGEPFGIPQPDELIFNSWFEGGEVFRSGCCFQREKGKIFYFRPGHETYPIFKNDDVLKVLDNAVRWASSEGERGSPTWSECEPHSPID